MSKVDPVVEQAVDTLDLNRVTRRRLLGGIGLTSASRKNAASSGSACPASRALSMVRARIAPEFLR